MAWLSSDGAIHSIAGLHFEFSPWQWKVQSLLWCMFCDFGDFKKENGFVHTNRHCLFNLTLVEELFILFWMDPGGLFAKHLISSYCIYHQGRAKIFLWLVNPLRRQEVKVSWLSQTVACQFRVLQGVPSICVPRERPCSPLPTPASWVRERWGKQRVWPHLLWKGQHTRTSWMEVLFGVKTVRGSIVPEACRVDGRLD